MSSNKLVTVHQPTNNEIIGAPIYISGVGAGQQGKITVRLTAQGHDGSLLEETYDLGKEGVQSNFSITVPLPEVPKASQGKIEVFSTDRPDGEPEEEIPIIFGNTLVSNYVGYRLYTIQEGDTLGKIANDFYNDEELYPRIENANPGIDPRDLPVGQNLRIPVGSFDERRRNLALQVREQAALIAYSRPIPEHKNNGEESEYRGPDGNLNYIANFTKGLPHNEFGEVDPECYEGLLEALQKGESAAFEDLKYSDRPAVNPQAGLAFSLQGPDVRQVKTRSEDGKPISIRPAPRIDGSEASAEMAEDYWMAVLRDTNFTDFEGSELAAKAAKSLTKEFSGFKGPKFDGEVTPGTLFRGFTKGDLCGPYISQFLLKGNVDDYSDDPSKQGLIKYGSLTIDLRQRTVPKRSDHMCDFDDWKDVQNGDSEVLGDDEFDTEARRFIRNPRDLGNYVHFDQLHQAYLNACLFLLAERDLGVVPLDLSPEQQEQTQLQPLVLDQRRASDGFAFPFDPGNPYRSLENQEGFGTFNGPHILSLVSEVTTRALKAVWYEKWFVHRRLRPEEFGGRLHVHLDDSKDRRYPEIEGTDIVDCLKHGSLSHHFGPKADADISFPTYLLPQVYPEGSPVHPAYGAGHSTVAGACVTVLKAFFDEDAVIRNPVKPSDDGTKLEKYYGEELTVGGELNKLAANISIGRNMAGVHWRTDYTESVKLGEAIAIDIMREQFLTFNEENAEQELPYFTLTKFDGQKIKISAEGISEVPKESNCGPAGSDDKEEFQAVLDKLPPEPFELRVTGSIIVPDRGFSVELSCPSGIEDSNQGKTLVLRLTKERLDGKFQQVISSCPVEYKRSVSRSEAGELKRVKILRPDQEAIELSIKEVE